ncbi:MAG: hypothetical protein QMC40_07270 [Vicingaceae bacterium]|jgi:hypothetical protein
MTLFLSFRRVFILLLWLCSAVHLNGQVVKIGAHSGVNISRLTIDQNKLSDAIFLRAGKPFTAFNFGVQLMVSPARNQSSPYWKWKPAILFEANLCRCGGFMELSLTSPNGIRTFSELKYRIYRGEYSAKLVGGFGPFEFMAGPTISNRFYSGVQIGVNEGWKYAGDQFKVLAFAYELGAGIKLNTVHLSARFQRFVGGYGRKSELIPIVFDHYQLRFMMHYYFLRRERGKNWDSIQWD